MKYTILCVRDKTDPNRYHIAALARPGQPGQMEIHSSELMTWREARRQLEPAAYYDMCAAAFADWCKRNGYA